MKTYFRIAKRTVMNEQKKWVTVQIWRRKRKRGVTFALRYGDPKRPKTVGLGRCTEDYAEFRRSQLEEELNRLPAEDQKAETDAAKIRLRLMALQLKKAGFVDEEIDKIFEIVRPYLKAR